MAVSGGDFFPVLRFQKEHPDAPAALPSELGEAGPVTGSGGPGTSHGAANLQVLFQLNLKTTRGEEAGPRAGDTGRKGRAA